MPVTTIDHTAIEPEVLLAALAEWAARIGNELKRFSALIDLAAAGTPSADDPRVEELLDALLREAHDA